MKLVSLKSDINTFRELKFNNNFSVITGDSEKKESSRSHNLGKSTTMRLIEYVLFSGSGSFLKKIKEIHPDSYFSISYKDNNKNALNFTRDFNRRKKGSLKEVISILDYEYFIRYQDEFDLENGFKKPNFRGSDLSWKPKLIGLLGFSGKQLEEKLTLNNEVKELSFLIKTIKKSKLKFEKNKEEIEKLQKEKSVILESIKTLKFIEIDKSDIKLIVEKLDNKIKENKSKIYNLSKEINKIESSLKTISTYTIDIEDIKRIFSEVNLYFEDQITKDFHDLKMFYKNINDGRSKILIKMFDEKQAELKIVNKELNTLDLDRSYKLKQLSKDDSKTKYKELYDRLVVIEKRLTFLERDIMKENISILEKQLLDKEKISDKSTTELSKHIDKDREIFNEINKIFSYIMKEVSNITAEIHINKKSTGNIDLILKSYRNGEETEELKGDSARRISSAAIDLSIRSIQNEDHGFILQDGVIDDVDPNTAKQFIKIVKELSTKYDFQYVLTALKDRLPENISENDIILELNDYSDKGLLFGFRY